MTSKISQRAQPKSSAAPLPDGNGLQDYFGCRLHLKATAVPVPNHNTGSTAQRHAADTVRCALNDGEYFPGYLVKWPVGHVTFYIGAHRVHGIAAYVDDVTAPHEGKIDVVTQGAKKPLALARHDFFDQLDEKLIPDQLIDDFCQDFYRAHFAMRAGKT